MLVSVSARLRPPTGVTLTAPATAQIGEVIPCSATATSPDGALLSVTWDFGDGATNSGDAVSHVYLLEGDFTIAATVADNRGLSTLATTTITVSGTGAAVASGSIHLNFKPGAKKTDSILLKGALPNGTTKPASAVSFDIGGIAASFALDAHGHGKSANATLSVKLPEKGATAPLPFTLSLKRGAFSSALGSFGLTNATVKSQAVTIPVAISVNAPLARRWQTQIGLTYSATVNKSGTAK